MVLLSKIWLSAKYNQKAAGMKRDSAKYLILVLNESFKIKQSIKINFYRLIC